MIKKLALCIVIALSALTTGITASHAEATLPTFQKVACRFTVPAGRTVDCGDLSVPESRTGVNRNTLKLHVAIFRAQSGHALPDPIVYLEGGPGGHSFDGLARRLVAFAPYMVDRDFIIYDQRGNGASLPALDCPEVTNVYYDYLNKPSGSTSSGSSELAALKKCRTRLTQQGINLSDYSSEANAADLNDLRLALGFKSWDLYGISYGTRLALVEMRDFPESVRSVVLDSTFPPDRNLNGAEFGPNAARGLKMLFDSCAKDSQCNTDFPTLRRVYTQLIQHLNARSITKPVVRPSNGQTYNLLLDGNRVSEAIFQALYSRPEIPTLPSIIYEAYNGNYDRMVQLAFRVDTIEESISEGNYYSVMCNDRNLPQFVCNLWGVQPSVPTKPQPVTSNLPTLVMAGDFDPVTAPEFGQRATKTLSNGFFFEYPGYGHGVTVDGTCPAQMMLAFLANPKQKPDSSCINQLTEPEFESSDF